jgi:hypothetical protein
MKIAFSASYFNCPPVREILETCDKIYTTNQFAVVKLATLPIELTTGPNIEAMRNSHPREDSVTFSDLFVVFNKWVANTATDEELYDWASYFATGDCAEMRKRASTVAGRTPSK